MTGNTCRGKSKQILSRGCSKNDRKLLVLPRIRLPSLNRPSCRLYSLSRYLLPTFYPVALTIVLCLTRPRISKSATRGSLSNPFGSKLARMNSMSSPCDTSAARASFSNVGDPHTASDQPSPQCIIKDISSTHLTQPCYLPQLSIPVECTTRGAPCP